MIPEHRILGIIRLRNAMVNVVDIDCVDRREHDIISSVVQGGEDSSQCNEYNHCVDMTWNNMDGEQVEILSCHELKWMHIDCIDIPTRGRFLSMMMFVYPRIQRTEMQYPMK